MSQEGPQQGATPSVRLLTQFICYWFLWIQISLQATLMTSSWQAVSRQSCRTFTVWWRLDANWVFTGILANVRLYHIQLGFLWSSPSPPPRHGRRGCPHRGATVPWSSTGQDIQAYSRAPWWPHLGRPWADSRVGDSQCECPTPVLLSEKQAYRYVSSTQTSSCTRVQVQVPSTTCLQAYRTVDKLALLSAQDALLLLRISSSSELLII